MLLAHKVSEAVARNPVARAVARRELLRNSTTLRVMAYLLDDGEECQQLLQDCGFLFAVASFINPDPRIAGALSAAAQMSSHGRWQRMNVVSIDVGIGLSVEAINAGSANAVRDAIQVVNAIR